MAGVIRRVKYYGRELIIINKKIINLSGNEMNNKPFA